MKGRDMRPFLFPDRASRLDTRVHATETRANTESEMMRRALAAGMVAGLAVFSVHAQVPETKHARNLAAGCTACHGTDNAKGFSTLAGRPRNEIVERMKQFKAGVRSSTLMGQLAKGYSDSEIDTIAAFFAAQQAGKAPP
jgi:cytochrome subunit of sulfide dehydrogenase